MTPADRHSAVDEIQTVVVNGLELAGELREAMSQEVSEIVSKGGRPPCLAVVLVGDDPASRSYIKGKQRACKRTGMDSRECLLPENTSEPNLLALIKDLNEDPSVDGILVQLPLPDAIDPNIVAEAILPAKDVDALHPITAGRLLNGRSELISCTPLGIMAILDRCGVTIEGARAVVIGRSNIVGKPISILLQQRNATVTLCHSRTRDLPAVCREADILVAAIGQPQMVKADWIKPGAAVMDVGVSEIDGKLVGDVDFSAALGIASFITPSRRGIGPMTITMLLRNTLAAYKARCSA